MGGRWRWIALIVASVAAVVAMGLVATQLQLSGDKDQPCGTALRIDLRGPTLLRDHANDLEAANGDPSAETERSVALYRAEAGALEDRCKDRQRLALLGLGAGGVAAASAAAWSTYQLGRRAGPPPRSLS